MKIKMKIEMKNPGMLVRRCPFFHFHFHLPILLLAITLLASCSMTKNLPEGKQLHYQTNFKFSNPEKVNRQKRLATDLSYIAKPIPATGLQKWQVGIHSSVNKKGKEKGFSAWLQRKFGRPPAYFDERKIEQSRLVMEKYLQDIGYFGASIGQDTSVRGKKVTVDYTITSKGQYFVREIFRPADTLELTHLLAQAERETLLKSGVAYSLPMLSNERARLAGLANEGGYFEVTKDNFYYFVDTTAGELQVDVYLKIKEAGDSSIHKIYYLDDSWVYPDHSLGRDTVSLGLDTLAYGELHVVQRQEILRSTVLNRMVWKEENALFSKKQQAETINRLLNLGIFKFANMRLEPEVRQDTNFLRRRIYLTPGLMRDFSTEFQVNSRSGNFLGTEVSASFSHKNLFRGAELFNVNLATGLETNIGANASSIVNTLNLGLNASLGLPSIYAPFVKRERVKGEVLPRTTFRIGDDFQKRTGFFTVNSFNLSAGYSWQRSPWQYELNPLFVNLVNVLQTSDELDALLLENRRLRSSFEDVLIAGISFKTAFSNQTTAKRGRHFFWRGGIESAGDLFYLATNPSGQGEQVLGIPFSQYLKLDSDIRQYFPLRKGRLAGRLNIGVGVPYGNSEVLPYTKQYFVGGASSIRAFRIRTLGPGGYESKLDDDGSNFVDQTGDLKLEMSLEYRFPVFSYLKGAVFADAGNVWLVRGDADESTAEVEGRFDFNSFYREIAVGTGFGARLDFEVAVIRLDWAFALRTPSDTAGNRWLWPEIDFLSRNWRKDNLVWNIAIGYPF